MAGSGVQVLLVEDNEIDVEAIRRSFRRHRVANPLVVARDGVEALGILRGEPGFPRLGRPHLVLLDLNMPRMGGLELLQAIRADRALAGTIVFVLTTSRSEEDKLASYRHNVAGYIVKGEVGEGFVRLVSLLDLYWQVVDFPPEAAGL